MKLQRHRKQCVADVALTGGAEAREHREEMRIELPDDFLVVECTAVEVTVQFLRTLNEKNI